MKKLLIKCVFATLVTVAYSSFLMAQSSTTKANRKIIKEDMENFQKLIDDPKKLNKLIRHTGGHGNKYERKYNYKNGFCTEADYQIPKKVGILTFYIADDDYTYYSSGTYYGTRTTSKASGEKVNAIAQLVFNESINDLKEHYQTLGMELLTPDEFLSTEEQKKIYYNYPLPNLEGKAYIFGASGSGAAVPEGYRLLPYPSISISGAKYFKEQRAFFMALDLDAFIVVQIDLIAASGRIKGVTSMFYYKNPGYIKSGVEKMVVGYDPYSLSTTLLKLDPPMNGIFVKEEQEYTTKKGKKGIKFVPVGINPNVIALIEKVVVQNGERSVGQITNSELKK